MLIDHGPRAESLGYLRGDAPIPELMRPEEIPAQDSPEAVGYLEDLKVLHYVRLARVIDVMLDRTLSLRSSRPPHGLERLEWVDDPFSLLRLDFVYTLGEDITAIADSEPFREASEVTRLIGQLDSKRYNNLEQQLNAGIGTAINLMLIVLKNLPRIVNKQAPNATADHGSVARRSFGLIRQPAMMSVNQMMATRSSLTGEADGSWGVGFSQLNPDHFKVLVKESVVQSVRYKDLAGQILPAGYYPNPYTTPLENDTSVRDIESSQKITIGCPVTLLDNRLNELWHWVIDVVEARNIWRLEPSGPRVRSDTDPQFTLVES